MCKVKHENLVKVLLGLNDMFVWLHRLSFFWDPLTYVYALMQIIRAGKGPLMVIVIELLLGMSLKTYLNSI